MDHLVDYIGDEWCFISDRQKGLQKIFEKDMEGCDWRICCRHLYANFRDQGFRGSVLKELLWNAARSYCESDFKHYMGEIAKCNAEAWEYLDAINPRQWSGHAFNVWTNSDELTNNSAESFNKDILDLRTKPIITMLEGIRTMIMLKFQQKREGAANHTLAYTPLALGRLNESIQASKYCKALYSGKGIYQVEDRDKRWVVNIINKVCGCGFWELVGIPCRHAVSALQLSGESLELYISRYYSLEMFKKCYEGIIKPLPSSDQWERTGLTPLSPPHVKPKTGRPAHKRRKSKNEIAGKPRTRVKSQRCSNCKEVGHKYVHCPKELVDGLKVRKRPSRAKKRVVASNTNAPTDEGFANTEAATNAPYDDTHQSVVEQPDAPAVVAEGAPVLRKHKKVQRPPKMTPYRGKRRKITSRDEGCSNIEATSNYLDLLIITLEWALCMRINQLEGALQQVGGEGDHLSQRKMRELNHLLLLLMLTYWTTDKTNM